MDFSKKLLMSTYRFPVVQEAPTVYSTTRVATVSAGHYSVYDVLEDGWYRVEVCAAGGTRGFNGPAGGAGGKRIQIVYLYQGQKCLMWAGAIGTGCAYPGTQTSELGGHGAVGADESGAGGGGPAVSPTSPNHAEGGLGGQGSGFIAGFTDTSIDDYSITAGSMTRAINYSLDTTAVSYLSISVYILAGGGGGGSSDSGNWRAGGGGGGAFGNGGSTYFATTGATSGPAGSSFGKGNNGSNFSAGASGAWAVVDFTTNTKASGTGGGSANSAGYVYLDKLTNGTQVG